LEALFFYIKAVPRSDPVPSEPMTSPQKRFCDFPLVELTGTIGYYSMLAGKGQAKRPGKAGKGARLEFSRFEPGPFNTCNTCIYSGIAWVKEPTEWLRFPLDQFERAE